LEPRRTHHVLEKRGRGDVHPLARGRRRRGSAAPGRARRDAAAQHRHRREAADARPASAAARSHALGPAAQGQGGADAEEDLVDYEDDEEDVAAAAAAAEAAAVAAAERRVNPSVRTDSAAARAAAHASKPSFAKPKKASAWGTGGLAQHGAAGAASGAAQCAPGGEAPAAADGAAGAERSEAARSEAPSVRSEDPSEGGRSARIRGTLGADFIATLPERRDARLAAYTAAEERASCAPDAEVDAILAEARTEMDAGEEEDRSEARRLLGFHATTNEALDFILSSLDEEGDGDAVPTVRAGYQYQVQLLLTKPRQHMFADPQVFASALGHIGTLLCAPDGATSALCSLRRTHPGGIMVMTTSHNLALELLCTEAGKFAFQVGDDMIEMSTPPGVEGVDVFAVGVSVLPVGAHVPPVRLLDALRKHPSLTMLLGPDYTLAMCRASRSTHGNAYQLFVVGDKGASGIGLVPACMPLTLDVSSDTHYVKNLHAEVHFYALPRRACGARRCRVHLRTASRCCTMRSSHGCGARLLA
jgi:hypothetical protein